MLFTLSEFDDSVELTAGCFAPVGTEEFRVPIKPPIREALSERAAGCSALLGTDGLVVLILLPMREVRSELILLLVFGAKRLPEMGAGMGKGIREFKDALRGGMGMNSGSEKQPPEEEKKD